MKTVEILREQIQFLSTGKLMIPPALCRKIIKKAKQARRRGENPKRIISRELTQSALTRAE